LTTKADSIEAVKSENKGYGKPIAKVTNLGENNPL
jgi:hypothetical protein